MTNRILFLLCMLSSSLAFSQTQSVNQPIKIADSSDYFFQKGLQEKKAGRKLESVKNFEKAKNFDSTNKEIVAELASAYYDMRRYNQAISNYKKLVELGDVSAATYKQLLLLSFNFKKYDEVKLYAEKLKKADANEKINFYLGKANYEEENYGDAIKYLELAAKEEPQNAEIPYMVARSYADMQNYKLSIPFFQKAITLDTTKNYWVYEMSLMYYALHDDKNSLKYMLQAGERGYKRDNDYLENLGIAYLNVGQFDEGVKILEELLKKRPSDMNILNMVAEAYYNKGKYQPAIDYWDQVLSIDKQNASALYMIGMSYQKKGEKEKGIRLCDKAIEMDPTLSSLKQKQMTMGM
ncbi:MAG: tetratricopeptide repeat protein [Chitinophagaceae bacterium]